MLRAPGHKKPRIMTEADDAKTEEAFFSHEGPEMKQPSIIHDGESLSSDTLDLDLEVGGMWSVAASALSLEDTEAHLNDLTCEPNKGKAAARPAAFGERKTVHAALVRQAGVSNGGAKTRAVDSGRAYA